MTNSIDVVKKNIIRSKRSFERMNSVNEKESASDKSSLSRNESSHENLKLAFVVKLDDDAIETPPVVRRKRNLNISDQQGLLISVQKQNSLDKTLNKPDYAALIPPFTKT